MNNKIKASLSIITLSITSTLFAMSPTEQFKPVGSTNSLHQRYIVSFNNASNINSHQSTLQSNHSMSFNQRRAYKNDVVTLAGGHVVKYLDSVDAVAALMTKAQVTELRQQADIAFIEKDPKRYVQAESLSWGMSDVQAAGQYPDMTDNRSVCIIDTGYDIQHEDLMSGANVTGNVSNTLTNDIDIGNWFDDSYGHGTMVAGIISAMTNSTGVRGIAYDNKLNVHSVKVIHNPNYWSIWGSDMIAALSDCQNNGANIVNISIAGSTASQAEEQAFQQANDNGMLIIASAGNRGNTQHYYPASYNSVMSVGATNNTQSRWNYSQYNDQVELVAPGTNILSTFPGNQYKSWDGTSMAAAFVSGIAAQAWSRNPTCSNTDVRSALQSSALDLGDPGRDEQYGFGLVQLNSAISAIESLSCSEVLNPGYDNLVQAEANSIIPLPFITSLSVHPEHGSINHNGAGWQYQANAGFSGVDQAKYLDENNVEKTIRFEVDIPGNGTTVRLGNGGTVRTIAGANNTFYVYSTGVNQIGHFDRFGHAIKPFTTIDDKYNSAPSIDINAAGNIIITKHSNMFGYARVYNSTLTPLTNWISLGYIDNAMVSASWLDDGSAVVAYQSLNRSYFRRINANFSVGPAVNVFGSGGSHAYNPDVITLKNGDFVVSAYVNHFLTTKRFSPNGTAIGSPIKLATAAAEISPIYFQHQSMTALEDGGYVAAWSSEENSISTLYTRYVSPDNQPAASQAVIVQTDPFPPRLNDIEALKDGGWAVVWQANKTSDIKKWATYIRYFDKNGASNSAIQNLTNNSSTWQYFADMSQLTDGSLITGIRHGNNIDVVFSTRSTPNTDIFRSMSGDQIIYAGGGQDEIYYPSLDTDFSSISQQDNSLRITDLRTNSPEGDDWLHGLELLHFTND